MLHLQRADPPLATLADQVPELDQLRLGKVPFEPAYIASSAAEGSQVIASA